MRIFLVRHGQSEGNVDRSAHRRKADHAINLTLRGEEQARLAGAALSEHIKEITDWEHCFTKLGLPAPEFRVWTSPYKRTRQTTEFLLEGLREKERSQILDVKEHVLLVEQQAGLFDGLSNEEYATELPRENAHYEKQCQFEGRFWAPCPMGESRFDVAQRVHQAFGTFQRDFDRHGIENLIVVTHGVTLRAFVMMWLHLPFEWIENERNPKNASIRLIEDGEDKGYIFKGFPKGDL